MQRTSHTTLGGSVCGEMAASDEDREWQRAEEALSTLISGRQRADGKNWAHAFDMMRVYLEARGALGVLWCCGDSSERLAVRCAPMLWRAEGLGAEGAEPPTPRPPALPNLPCRLQRLDLTEELNKLSVIHVAGTKGKGSTSAMVESLLRRCGYRTGLYTSPHLIDVRERIRIDGWERGVRGRRHRALLPAGLHWDTASEAGACWWLQPLPQLLQWGGADVKPHLPPPGFPRPPQGARGPRHLPGEPVVVLRPAPGAVRRGGGHAGLLPFPHAAGWVGCGVLWAVVM